MRVVVDWNLCESNALCMAAAPDIFELQDDDTLQILQETPDESQRDAVVRAAQACPKRAISVLD